MSSSNSGGTSCPDWMDSCSMLTALACANRFSSSCPRSHIKRRSDSLDSAALDCSAECNTASGTSAAWHSSSAARSKSIGQSSNNLSAFKPFGLDSHNNLIMADAYDTKCCTVREAWNPPLSWWGLFPAKLAHPTAWPHAQSNVFALLSFSPNRSGT